jgi:hypothetical protein
MGATQAHAFAEAVNDGEVSIKDAIAWHLQSNHYPPVPSIMVEPCIEAISNVEAGFPEDEVALPEGVSFRGRKTAPARDIVEQHHLYAFINEEY